MAVYKDVYKDMQKGTEQLKIISFIIKSLLPLYTAKSLSLDQNNDFQPELLIICIYHHVFLLVQFSWLHLPMKS
jgi:hypothetical protein